MLAGAIGRRSAHAVCALARLPRASNACTARPQIFGAPASVRTHSAATPGFEPKKALKPVHFKEPYTFDEQLDLNRLITQPVYVPEERESVAKTHRSPTGTSDRAAYNTVRLLRFGFDLASGYLWKARLHKMTERDWLRRILFLETVAGVPGMVAGVLRHFKSLGMMRRDHGWIHSLLAEAENERMHLMIALRLRKPGLLFRGAVVATQMLFVSYYTAAYVVSPNYCHRFVGYLEEEAVKTYSHLLDDIDSGNLPLFEKMPAPVFASLYYKLPQGAMLRDVFACIRADEAHHRDANHHFGDLQETEPNLKVEHLRPAPTRPVVGIQVNH